MKLTELKRLVDLAVNNNRYADQTEVVIVTKLPYSTVGGTPRTAVKSASLGFDWDNGNFMIWPIEPMTLSTKELEEKFEFIEKKSGDLFLENSGLKAELKRIKGGK
jgi:hypothetical protein